MTYYAKRFITILLLVLWCIFFLGMQLACFDVFEDNLWYFYFLALGFFLLQFFIVMYYYKNKSWVIVLFAIVYGSALLFKDCYFVVNVLCPFFSGSPVGLHILSLLCDLTGFVICCLCYRKIKRQTTG